MNITNSLNKRIANRLTETKNPCRTYPTKAKAEAAAEKWAAKGSEYFGVEDVRYLVLYIPQMDRYTVCFDLNYILKSGGNGGYLGFFKDFYTF